LGEIRDKIARKLKFSGQLRAKLMKFKTTDLFALGAWIQGSNLVENMGVIEEIKSLNANWG
jgi:hypothetical protein